jgi:flagellar biogenesis protein FliO
MAPIDWPRLVLSLLGVAVALAAFLWWFRRRQGVGLLRQDNRRIQVHEVYPLGLKHKMMLIQADEQMLLVSVNVNDIRTLHAWPAGDQGETHAR